MSVVSKVLSNPRFYRLTQRILAPGANAGLTAAVKAVINRMPSVGDVLDVGCGPESWLASCGVNPIGLDISHRYIQRFNQHTRGRGVVASATSLPFRERSVDATWSIGLFHHLPDDMVVQSIQEMLRVTRSKGYVALIDGVLPCLSLRRVIAYSIRKLDRGRFFRTQDQLCSLLSREVEWQIERIIYTETGLEAVVCVARMEKNAARNCF